MHIIFVAVTSALSTPPAPLREPPDPTVNSISIGSSSFTQQSLPLSYISEWPVWMASESGDAVSLLPTAGEEAEEAGWVNPATFEQLWQPQDLPRPAARAAIGAVCLRSQFGARLGAAEIASCPPLPDFDRPDVTTAMTNALVARRARDGVLPGWQGRDIVAF